MLFRSGGCCVVLDGVGAYCFCLERHFLANAFVCLLFCVKGKSVFVVCTKELCGFFCRGKWWQRGRECVCEREKEENSEVEEKRRKKKEVKRGRMGELKKKTKR